MAEPTPEKANEPRRSSRRSSSMFATNSLLTPIPTAAATPTNTMPPPPNPISSSARAGRRTSNIRRNTTPGTPTALDTPTPSTPANKFIHKPTAKSLEDVDPAFFPWDTYGDGVEDVYESITVKKYEGWVEMSKQYNTRDIPRTIRPMRKQKATDDEVGQDNSDGKGRAVGGNLLDEIGEQNIFEELFGFHLGGGGSPAAAIPSISNENKQNELESMPYSPPPEQDEDDDDFGFQPDDDSMVEDSLATPLEQSLDKEDDGIFTSPCLSTKRSSAEAFDNESEIPTKRARTVSVEDESEDHAMLQPQEELDLEASVLEDARDATDEASIADDDIEILHDKTTDEINVTLAKVKQAATIIREAEAQIERVVFQEYSAGGDLSHHDASLNEDEFAEETAQLVENILEEADATQLVEDILEEADATTNEVVAESLVDDEDEDVVIGVGGRRKRLRSPSSSLSRSSAQDRPEMKRARRLAITIEEEDSDVEAEGEQADVDHYEERQIAQELVQVEEDVVVVVKTVSDSATEILDDGEVTQDISDKVIEVTEERAISIEVIGKETNEHVLKVVEGGTTEHAPESTITEVPAQAYEREDSLELEEITEAEFLNRDRAESIEITEALEVAPAEVMVQISEREERAEPAEITEPDFVSIQETVNPTESPAPSEYEQITVHTVIRPELVESDKVVEHDSSLVQERVEVDEELSVEVAEFPERSFEVTESYELADAGKVEVSSEEREDSLEPGEIVETDVFERARREESIESGEIVETVTPVHWQRETDGFRRDENETQVDRVERSDRFEQEELVSYRRDKIVETVEIATESIVDRIIEEQSLFKEHVHLEEEETHPFIVEDEPDLWDDVYEHRNVKDINHTVTFPQDALYNPAAVAHNPSEDIHFNTLAYPVHPDELDIGSDDDFSFVYEAKPTKSPCQKIILDVHHAAGSRDETLPPTAQAVVNEHDDDDDGDDTMPDGNDPRDDREEDDHHDNNGEPSVDMDEDEGLDGDHTDREEMVDVLEEATEIRVPDVIEMESAVFMRDEVFQERVDTDVEVVERDIITRDVTSMDIIESVQTNVFSTTESLVPAETVISEAMERDSDSALDITESLSEKDHALEPVQVDREEPSTAVDDEWMVERVTSKVFEEEPEFIVETVDNEVPKTFIAEEAALSRVTEDYEVEQSIILDNDCEGMISPEERVDTDAETIISDERRSSMADTTASSASNHFQTATKDRMYPTENFTTSETVIDGFDLSAFPSLGDNYIDITPLPENLQYDDDEFNQARADDQNLINKIAMATLKRSLGLQYTTEAEVIQELSRMSIVEHEDTINTTTAVAAEGCELESPQRVFRLRAEMPVESVVDEELRQLATAGVSVHVNAAGDVGLASEEEIHNLKQQDRTWMPQPKRQQLIHNIERKWEKIYEYSAVPKPQLLPAPPPPPFQTNWEELQNYLNDNYEMILKVARKDRNYTGLKLKQLTLVDHYERIHYAGNYITASCRFLAGLENGGGVVDLGDIGDMVPIGEENWGSMYGRGKRRKRLDGIRALDVIRETE